MKKKNKINKVDKAISPDKKENILTVNKLKKYYLLNKEKEYILKDISLNIEKGSFTSIMGPSGSGKSTLLYILGGLDYEYEGEVIFKDKDLKQYSEREKAMLKRRNVGFIFQFYNLVMNLSVEDNIMLPMLLDGKKKKDNKEILEEMLEITGLTKKREFTPRQLSGGQQQRVAIARALAFKPDLILADEPIGNLDSKNGIQIMELFQRINKEYGTTIVQVTHSVESAEYGQHVITLKDGMISKIV